MVSELESYVVPFSLFLPSHLPPPPPPLFSHTLSLSLSLSQVMERFDVDIRFPKDKGSSVVVIQGLEENVEDAKEHLITLAEDYVSTTHCIHSYHVTSGIL